MKRPVASTANIESENHLVSRLRNAPQNNEYRYTSEARLLLLRDLFGALACNKPEYLNYFFPNGPPQGTSPADWNLSLAQGASDGAEYSETARGKPCGHIFKSGEASYRCKTCSLDDTCVLCGRCFESSDHTGHTVYVIISTGTSGCCDCGDPEAWKIPVKCSVHTPLPHGPSPMDSEASPQELPPDLVVGIRSTIARAIDYLCDVISCSPEQLRLPKTEEGIRSDEESSRLTSRYFSEESATDRAEYALIIWNDEKHTIDEVEDQVARACKKTRRFGKERAQETHFVGRSIVAYNHSLPELMRISSIIEQIKITVTIRSARDTFREQMCGTIVEWLGDIAGCSVGGHNDILRTTICEELLGVWRVGSEASNTEVGKKGIDDHAVEEDDSAPLGGRRVVVPIEVVAGAGTDDDVDMDEGDIEDQIAEDVEHDEDDGDGEADDDVDMVGSVLAQLGGRIIGAIGMGPPNQIGRAHTNAHTTAVQGETAIEQNREASNNALVYNEEEMPDVPPIPRTPGSQHSRRPGVPVPKHWLEKPAGYANKHPVPPHEDLRQRVRLDWLILFDLRLWKKARIDLRDLYISTVVAIPEFKRILGLRFSGLYTVLSQLYLVPDREPEHSIINLSLQILTTPSITAEVVKRGNFLTNQLAILYTFLTTRQVGHPHEVNQEGTLAFDTGSLTNRRMFHFFQDMRYLFASDYVQDRLRHEERYMLQFLDLVTLHQGICPNTRAVGEHVEYEAEAWISASLITREINRLVRQFSEAYRWTEDPHDNSLQRAISTVTRYAAINSLGCQRHRFNQAEIKYRAELKQAIGFQFDTDRWGNQHHYKIVKFAVDKQPISFHHALHYTLSWLIEAGKNMDVRQLRKLLMPDWEQIKRASDPETPEYEPEDTAIVMFDFPLRVCVWLAQMKAGMWVRNGFSLRHQMQTYRSVSQREMAHSRDIFLLQTSLVTINPSRMLVTMIDRFNLNHWVEGNFGIPQGYEDSQVLDLAEDLLHLLIVILSDRLPLIPIQEEPDLALLKLKREIVHILCFKPIQFSDLTTRLPERLQELDKFQDILEEMTIFRPPDGLSDSGTFELKEEYHDEVDPYILQFSKNQREETENSCCARIAKRTGRLVSEVAFEPKLREIKTGVFSDIAVFTRTPVFAQIIYYSLAYGLQFKSYTPSVQESRVETFLQLCLHLCQLAVAEDKTIEGQEENSSFILHALEKKAKGGAESSEIGNRTIATVLHRLSSIEAFKACRPKIDNILRRMRQKKPAAFEAAAVWAHEIAERMDTETEQNTKDAEAERKQLARERQAKIMAQMKQQQQSFLNSAGFDFGDEEFTDSENEEKEYEEEKKWWKYPAGTCLLCQEEMTDSRLYGALALISDSNISRQTPVNDPNYVYEVLTLPNSLDRPADEIRPYGVASMNLNSILKLAADGTEFVVKRQSLGQGFPPESVTRGPVATGCSHVMHFSCFEHYYESTKRRHPQQIARDHPERLELKEFVCPLCKALGNAFLPIVWRAKEVTAAGVLKPPVKFEQWLGEKLGSMAKLKKAIESDGLDRYNVMMSQEMFYSYGSSNMIAPIGNKLSQLSTMHVEPRFPELGSSRPAPTLSFGVSEAAPRPGAVIPPPVQTELDELHKIYRRLRDTLITNKIHTRYPSPEARLATTPAQHNLTHCDSMAKIFGFTISAVEIAQRGVGSEPGMTLLDRISQQVLTHLRILSETISSYIAVGGLQNSEKNKTIFEFKDMQRQQIQRLLIGHPEVYDDLARTKLRSNENPLFIDDIFVFLADVFLVNWFNNLLAAWRQSGRARDVQNFTNFTERQLNTFRQFTEFVRQSSRLAPDTDNLPLESVAIMRALVKKYATTFLRKSVILLHVQYGIVFPNTGFGNIDDPEVDRLSEALGLPSFDEMLSSWLMPTTNGEYLRSMISAWCAHASANPKNISLSHPAIFELVGLPLHYETLIDEAMKRKCPKSGKDLSDPNVCLFCGEIICSQAVCCTDRGRGGCNQHVDKSVPFSLLAVGTVTHCFCVRCGKDIGVFINIRKGCVIYLHNGHGSYGPAPYLDKYGEVDWGLRRNRQLFLNQRRYDALMRNTWLQHGVPSVISRKLEADINSGGWETL
ncbi:unnamed protein product [Tuber aestivum]|uniref:E3 ubiquitin-protein ligase n=1 Tax=Tuber aestivum TaxID=59557 RepID=A0A292PLJ9_9PEZI|nr:unnamed protein product [Tuber aestivum]